jgi:putative peptide zinc metalloprotease protein
MSISLATQIELYPGTEIVEFDGSGRGMTFRVETADGRHFQINEKLYALLDCLRVPASLALLAERFQARTGEAVALADLQQLSTRLEAQGVILRSGATPQPRTDANPQATSFLALHYHRDIVSAQALAPFAHLLQVLFTRPVAVVIVVLIAAAHVLAYRQVGFPPNLQLENVNYSLLYGVMLASFLLHELGHLAACRRWHCPHGPLGFGLYFFNPVFYVNVTAAWRLSRRQRAVLDLGGIYVQLAFVSALSAAAWLVHDNTFLLALLFTDMLVLANFEPFMKLDGYWLLSDLAGVPNLHARAGEITKQWWVRLQHRLGRRSAVLPAAQTPADWSPLVRAVVFAYVALSILIWPLMLLGMIPMVYGAVTTYPALWSTAFTDLGTALAAGNAAAVLAQLQVLFIPTLMVVNLAFLLKRLSGRLFQRLGRGRRTVGGSIEATAIRQKAQQI